MRTDTVVIGASAAGLATAACLSRAGAPHVVLEQEAHVAHAWRNHYDRLRLHTTRGLSGLPFHPMPRTYPRYPSRDQVVAYLEDYARALSIKPWFGARVRSVRRESDGWITTTERDERIVSRNVVVATGHARVPHEPTWPGRAEYRGEVVHSSRYGNGERFRGKPVLVIGIGNSGAEIAIDLHEHGAKPTIAVRGAVNVVPRDILGVPVLAVALALDSVSARLADELVEPLVRASIGDVTKIGLRKLPYGPIVQVREHARVPLVDIGTIDLVRRGHVRIGPGVRCFTPEGVEFDDGTRAPFDAVVLATGYRPALADFLDVADRVTGEQGLPTRSGYETLPGLYFCGFFLWPTGLLREIGIEAKRIARSIARSLPARA
jgi:NADPH-dependent 2,4-dienoyl-CoA reductase/sulfur reductase-like enzyme